jgi:hypothetical protein
MKCNCKYCRRGRSIRKIASKLNKRDGERIRKLLSELIHTEMDMEYYRAKYKGKWPSDQDRIKEMEDTIKTLRGKVEMYKSIGDALDDAIGGGHV